jgi:hypothetical protein
MRQLDVTRTRAVSIRGAVTDTAMLWTWRTLLDGFYVDLLQSGVPSPEPQYGLR